MRTATLSECGLYRYTLERETGLSPTAPTLAWLMLNPSTADHTVDDPTIRKVVQFTRRAGFARLIVVNLFAWRETDPALLRRVIRDGHHRLEGPDNRAAIEGAAERSEAVVCAWGAQPWAAEQAERVLGWLTGRKLLCLGRTKSGAPLHPLMPSYDGHPLIPFETDEDRLGTEHSRKDSGR